MLTVHLSTSGHQSLILIVYLSPSGNIIYIDSTYQCIRMRYLYGQYISVHQDMLFVLIVQLIASGYQSLILIVNLSPSGNIICIDGTYQCIRMHYLYGQYISSASGYVICIDSTTHCIGMHRVFIVHHNVKGYVICIDSTSQCIKM